MWRASLLTAVRTVLVCAAVAVSACATQSANTQRFKQPYAAREPRVSPDVAIAARAAATAESMVGAPYRWGGHAPGGFDCSGLVYYSYGSAGAAIPRTSNELFSSSRPIPLDEMRAGDLVFFSDAGKVSHVGIYLSDGRFVHAPSAGKRRVKIASLRSGYYERNFIRAGRLALN